MRFIPFKSLKTETDQVNTFFLLAMYLNDARQSGGVDYEEMGRRIDLVKRIRAMEPKDGEPAPDGLTVSMEEYRILKGIETYRWPWGANELVYEIVGDVINAKAPALQEVPAAKAG